MAFGNMVQLHKKRISLNTKFTIFLHAMELLLYVEQHAFMTADTLNIFGQISLRKLIQGIPIRAKNVKNKTNDFESAPQWFLFSLFFLPLHCLLEQRISFIRFIKFYKFSGFLEILNWNWNSCCTSLDRTKTNSMADSSGISSVNDARDCSDWWNPCSE